MLMDDDDAIPEEWLAQSFEVATLKSRKERCRMTDAELLNGGCLKGADYNDIAQTPPC